MSEHYAGPPRAYEPTQVHHSEPYGATHTAPNAFQETQMYSVADVQQHVEDSQKHHRSLEPYPGQPSYPHHQQSYAPQPYAPQAYAQPQFAPQAQYAPGYYPQTSVGMVGRQPVSGALVAVAWIIAVITFFYMLPWAIAVTRNRSNMAAIGILNFLLGWTFLGWLASLVMACGSESTTNVVVVNSQQPQYAPQQYPPRY